MKAHRLANMAEGINLDEASVLDKLKKVGIKTMADLDAYIKKHPLPNGDLESRYHTLKKLVGEKAADKIMHELMVQSWKMGKKGMGEETENLEEGTIGDLMSKMTEDEAQYILMGGKPSKFKGEHPENLKIAANKVMARYDLKMRQLALDAHKRMKKMKKEETENVQEIAPAQVEATDPDGEMALTQLKNTAAKASALLKMIQPNSKLEPWVQSKITLADDYITTIHDYLTHTPGAIGEAFEDFEESTRK